MTTFEGVTYQGMNCGVCGRALFIMDEGATATIWCDGCGPQQAIMTTPCRGNGCNERIIFGGPGGRSPINVRTGESHFVDCVAAKSFRRKQ